MLGCERKLEPEQKQPSVKQKVRPTGSITQVVGVARNAKLSAAVVDGERVVYCLDRARWPDGVLDKQLLVEGHIEKTEEFKATTSPTGEVSQGTAGGDLVIRQCRAWKLGPPIRPASALLESIERHDTGSVGKRSRLRVPIVAFFEDEHRLALRRAVVGVSLEDSNEVALHLDDSGLGISLIDRLRRLCAADATTCAVWVEGYWGPLLEDPSAGSVRTQPPTMTVTDVLLPTHQSLGSSARVLVEVPEDS